jgi:hypothetical protein
MRASRAHWRGVRRLREARVREEQRRIVSQSILREIEGLQGQTVAKLREKYREVLGEDSRSNHKQYLVRRIAWWLQAEAEGGLSERARRRAEELARDADLRLVRPHHGHPSQSTRRDLSRDPRLPAPGAVLTRSFRGRLISVEILEHGFRHEGCVYRSLSAIARRVSGTAWNGFSFFGLGGRVER